jgi:hypothetical protein
MLGINGCISLTGEKERRKEEEKVIHTIICSNYAHKRKQGEKRKIKDGREFRGPQRRM